MSSEESSEYDNFLATQQTREDCPEPPDAATIGCFNSKVSGSPPGLSKRSRKLRKHKKRNNAARQLFYDHSSNPESSAQQSNEEAALAYIKAKAADTLSKCRKELLKAVPELLENFVFPEDIMKAARKWRREQLREQNAEQWRQKGLAAAVFIQNMVASTAGRSWGAPPGLPRVQGNSDLNAQFRADQPAGQHAENIASENTNFFALETSLLGSTESQQIDPALLNAVNSQYNADADGEGVSDLTFYSVSSIIAPASDTDYTKPDKNAQNDRNGSNVGPEEATQYSYGGEVSEYECHVNSSEDEEDQDYRLGSFSRKTPTESTFTGSTAAKCFGTNIYGAQ